MKGISFYSIIIFLIIPLSISFAQDDPTELPWEKPKLEGKHFKVDGINNLPDLHGDIIDPQLVVFFAGNQYMVVEELMDEFKKENPDVERIYFQTLPPGIEAEQYEKGALVIGNLRIETKPDILTAGHGRIAGYKNDKGWFNNIYDYARNRLAIMVYKDNPKNISSLNDLGKDDINVSMPNPDWEGIATPIQKAYVNEGGEDLKNRIMQDKKDNNTTFLTKMHHRQTPLRIMRKESDAGPVWYTETYYHAKMKNHPIAMVEIPDSVNEYVTYTAGVFKDAPHPDIAEKFIKFLTEGKGQEVYKKYGFLPPEKQN